MPKRDPYILDRPTGRRLRARDALVCIGVTIVLLLVVEGRSIRHAGEEMDGGIERTAVLAVGRPAGWLADRLPFADGFHRLTASLSPDEELRGPGGFEDAASVPRAAGGVAPIGPEAFDPAELGEKPVRLPDLRTLLVTGDSLAQPLDVELARRLAGDGVRTVRDAHLGTSLSNSGLVDWGVLSVKQVRERRPDAVVVFIGANEGFPIPDAGARLVPCCGPAWAAAYATRARRMMDTYRRRGSARVYWLTLPLPRDAARQRIARSVNAAIAVAAEPYRAHVRVLDMAAVFTPGGRFRSAMPVGGSNTIVREPDGIHLNAAGARVAAELVIARLRADFASLR